MVPRALDHIVWPARDLDGLAEAFRRLGFSVGRRNRHPWGTLNHIIQFDGCFLELLGFAEDYRPLPPDDPARPFAGFCEAFLDTNSAGAAMLVLRSDDAAADAQAFVARGIGRGRLLPFSRAAQGPDGSDQTVSFTVAFADLPALPEIGVFVCQQHRPENFWDPTAQMHPNGATGVAGLTLLTSDPAAGAAALQQFTDGIPVTAPGGGVHIALASGALEILPLPDETQPGREASHARLSALTIDAADLSRVARVLDQTGMPYAAFDDQLVVRPPEFGSTSVNFRVRS